MPQGVVRDDGGLTQAHALTNCFAAPAVGGGLSRGKKSRVITPGSMRR